MNTNMADKFTHHTESPTEINITIAHLKSVYKIESKYDQNQKNNSGKLLPYELIDKSIYRQAAHCVCFITSNERVHAWISSLAHCLYLTSDSRYKVEWRDRKEKDSIVQTEFMVRDLCNNGEFEGDDFLYKVIVYLTTGKILVQG